jgi:hypothetical protein
MQRTEKRSHELLAVRDHVTEAVQVLYFAIHGMPEDPAFDGIRADLRRLRLDLEARGRELLTYASAAASIESTQHSNAEAP